MCLSSIEVDRGYLVYFLRWKLKQNIFWNVRNLSHLLLTTIAWTLSLTYIFGRSHLWKILVGLSYVFFNELRKAYRQLVRWELEEHESRSAWIPLIDGSGFYRDYLHASFWPPNGSFGNVYLIWMSSMCCMFELCSNFPGTALKNNLRMISRACDAKLPRNSVII